MNKNRDRNQLLRELMHRPIDSVPKVRALMQILQEGEVRVHAAPDDSSLENNREAVKNRLAEIAWERQPEAIEFLLSEIQRLNRLIKQER